MLRKFISQISICLIWLVLVGQVVNFDAGNNEEGLSNNLREVFLSCSSKCFSNPTCVGIILYKTFETKYETRKSNYFCRTESFGDEFALNENRSEHLPTIVYKVKLKGKSTQTIQKLRTKRFASRLRRKAETDSDTTIQRVSGKDPFLTKNEADLKTVSAGVSTEETSASGFAGVIGNEDSKVATTATLSDSSGESSDSAEIDAGTKGSSNYSTVPPTNSDRGSLENKATEDAATASLSPEGTPESMMILTPSEKSEFHDSNPDSPTNSSKTEAMVTPIQYEQPETENEATLRLDENEIHGYAVPSPSLKPLKPENETAVTTHENEPQENTAPSASFDQVGPKNETALGTDENEAQENTAPSVAFHQVKPETQIAVGTGKDAAEENTAPSASFSQVEPENETTLGTGENEAQENTAPSVSFDQSEPENETAAGTDENEMEENTPLSVSSDQTEPENETNVSTDGNEMEENTVPSPSSEPLKPDTGAAFSTDENKIKGAIPSTSFELLQPEIGATARTEENKMQEGAIPSPNPSEQPEPENETINGTDENNLEESTVTSTLPEVPELETETNFVPAKNETEGSGVTPNLSMQSEPEDEIIHAPPEKETLEATVGSIPSELAEPENATNISSAQGGVAEATVITPIQSVQPEPENATTTLAPSENDIVGTELTPIRSGEAGSENLDLVKEAPSLFKLPHISVAELDTVGVISTTEGTSVLNPTSIVHLETEEIPSSTDENKIKPGVVRVTINIEIPKVEAVKDSQNLENDGNDTQLNSSPIPPGKVTHPKLPVYVKINALQSEETESSTSFDELLSSQQNPENSILSLVISPQKESGINSTGDAPPDIDASFGISEVEADNTTVDPGCQFEDRERYRRNIDAATYALLNDEPVLLTFVQGTDCIASYSKNGHHGFHGLRKLFPDFPFHTQVSAAGFFNNTLYLIDSSEAQNVHPYEYNMENQAYQRVSPSTLSRADFLKRHCGLTLDSKTRIQAFGQLSIMDSICIVFNRSSRKPVVSPSAGQDEIDLAKSIQFVLDAEYIDWAEAVFAWLDEKSSLSTFYIFGSNGELYELTRDEANGSQWIPGNYENIPYEDFPN